MWDVLGGGNRPLFGGDDPVLMSHAKALPPHGGFKWDVAAFLYLAFVLATRPLPNLSTSDMGPRCSCLPHTPSRLPRSMSPPGRTQYPQSQLPLCLHPRSTYSQRVTCLSSREEVHVASAGARCLLLRKRVSIGHRDAVGVRGSPLCCCVPLAVWPWLGGIHCYGSR